MRVAVTLFVASLFMAVHVKTTSTGTTDRRGQEVLERALAAVSGAGRVAAVRYWHVEGEGRENLTADLQGLAPQSATWRSHDEKVAVDATAWSVAWERRSARNDDSVRWRRVMLSAGGSAFFDWVVERGGGRDTPVPEPARRALARRMPHLLLLEAAASGTARWMGEARVEGRAADLVSVSLAEAAALTLAIGRSEPPVLERVQFTSFLPGAGDVPVAWTWKGWRPHADLGTVPAGHEVTIDGVLFHDVRYRSYEAQAARPPLLDLPAARLTDAGPPPDQASPPLPPLGEVAPGVHVIDAAGFVSLIVEFRDFLVVMDAPAVHPGWEGIPARPGSTQPTTDLLAVVARTAPGKPVRYAVLSHHHSDHLGGAALVASAGATLLVAPGHRDAARRVIERARVANPHVEVVADRKVLTDGVRTLEILNIGRGPHADETLFAWLPAERIAFQGDLFYYAAGGSFPPSGRGTMNRFFADWIAGRGMSPLAVYGVHNDGAAGTAMLERSRR